MDATTLKTRLDQVNAKLAEAGPVRSLADALVQGGDLDLMMASRKAETQRRDDLVHEQGVLAEALEIVTKRNAKAAAQTKLDHFADQHTEAITAYRVAAQRAVDLVAELAALTPAIFAGQQATAAFAGMAQQEAKVAGIHTTLGGAACPQLSTAGMQLVEIGRKLSAAASGPNPYTRLPSERVTRRRRSRSARPCQCGCCRSGYPRLGTACRG